MKIDIQVISYKQPHPLMFEAMNKLIEHTRCKCVVDAIELVRDCSVTLQRNSQNGRKDMVKVLADGGLANALHEPHLCPRGKHDVVASPRGSSSVVHWSRNALMQNRRKDADYVLLCDDDIIPPVDALDRMLIHKKDVVSGLCTKRQDPPEPTMRIWDEWTQNYSCLLKWEEKRLLEVDAVGTGFLLLSRQVIEHVAVAYHREHYERYGNGFWFEFLRNPNGGEWGEDLSFCFKAQRLGYKIYVDTTVCAAHIGDYNYTVDDYLPYQEEVIAAGSLDRYRRQQPDASAAIYGRRPERAAPADKPTAPETQPEAVLPSLDIVFGDGAVLAEKGA